LLLLRVVKQILRPKTDFFFRALRVVGALMVGLLNLAFTRQTLMLYYKKKKVFEIVLLIIVDHKGRNCNTPFN